MVEKRLLSGEAEENPCFNEWLERVRDPKQLEVLSLQELIDRFTDDAFKQRHKDPDADPGNASAMFCTADGRLVYLSLSKAHFKVEVFVDNCDSITPTEVEFLSRHVSSLRVFKNLTHLSHNAKTILVALQPVVRRRTEADDALGQHSEATPSGLIEAIRRRLRWGDTGKS